MIHNRTVNLKGGLGRNVAMDRVCEFLNAEFKGKCFNLHIQSDVQCVLYKQLVAIYTLSNNLHYNIDSVHVSVCVCICMCMLVSTDCTVCTQQR